MFIDHSPRVEFLRVRGDPCKDWPLKGFTGGKIFFIGTGRGGKSVLVNSKMGARTMTGIGVEKSLEDETYHTPEGTKAGGKIFHNGNRE